MLVKYFAKTECRFKLHAVVTAMYARPLALIECYMELGKLCWDYKQQSVV